MAVKSMQSRHMDFGTPSKLSDYAPLTFSIAGEDFSCKPAIQGAVLLDFITEADSNDGGRAAVAIRRFFEEAMPRDDFERFYKLIEESEYIFDMEEISSITTWLVEQYSSRPKELSKRSSAGPKKSGITSMDAAS